jgi:DNA-binding XRE family transcriptional regulator
LARRRAWGSASAGTWASSRAHISQEELALRADIHRTRISMFESGQRVPLVGTALKLAAALDVELSTLLDGIVHRRGSSPRLGVSSRSPRDLSSRMGCGGMDTGGLEPAVNRG